MAVQEHSGGAETPKLPVPPPAGRVVLVGDRPVAQFRDNWVMVRVWPETLTVPLYGLSVTFAATL